MTSPLKRYKTPHAGGVFGAVRKYDIHTGIDLYCESGDPVYAIEDGIVVNVCHFTGQKVGSDWWNDTDAVLIEGKSGVILYGELESKVKVGDSIKEGQHIGNILTVLKVDKGLPINMLHLELYKSGYRGDGEIWNLNTTKPDMLLDPNILIK